MTKGIQDRLTQSFGRYLQIFITDQSDNLSVHIQVFAEEVHRLVEQYEYVPFHSLIVNKLILVSTLETSQTHCELCVHASIFREERRCGIQRSFTCGQLPFAQHIFDRFNKSQI